MGHILPIKGVAILAMLALALLVGCHHGEGEDKVGADTENVPAEGSFVLQGTLRAPKLHNERAVFRVQLVKGDRTGERHQEGSVHPEAWIQAVRNGQGFEFDGLTSGDYTLVATREGYTEVLAKVSMGWWQVYLKDIIMYPVEDDGEEFRILDEEGKEKKCIELIPFSTQSIIFYLYNATASDMSYNLSHYMSSGSNVRSFIINGKVERVYSDWIKEINPRSGVLSPNILQPIEIRIDPTIYLVNGHSKCNILVNHRGVLELSF
ncbi:MAG: hypothetical protein NC396_03515 [Bacteroides sp.]|nr:hypothetical protein [Bacteroides sp.]MCM1085294.1 hypothetical protein [Bacteroides sp.]